MQHNFYLLKKPPNRGLRDRMNLTVNMVIQSFIYLLLILKFLFYKYNDSFLKYKLLCHKNRCSQKSFL